MKKQIKELFDTWLKEEGEDFAGVLSATDEHGVLYEKAIGLQDRSHNLPCQVDTAFGIASGTKLFTGLAICRLIDKGLLKLEDNLGDIFQRDLGQIDKGITIYQLLTHTSGVGDYVDEDAEDFDAQYEALMTKYPAHLWKNMEYYWQMITDLPPKFKPGERFCYSNSGFILLGLVVEAVSGLSYQAFVQREIIEPCGLTHTGFYPNNALPPNTSLGYAQDEDTGKWQVNTGHLPIIGGSDGGIYACAADIDKLWRCIFKGDVLSPEMTAAFLKPQVVSEEDEEDNSIESYGLGVYHYQEGDKSFYFIIGVDNGVGFFSGYYPATKIVLSSFSNTGYHGAFLHDAPFLCVSS